MYTLLEQKWTCDIGCVECSTSVGLLHHLLHMYMVCNESSSLRNDRHHHAAPFEYTYTRALVSLKDGAPACNKCRLIVAEICRKCALCVTQACHCCIRTLSSALGATYGYAASGLTLLHLDVDAQYHDPLQWPCHQRTYLHCARAPVAHTRVW
jgi:hypothetical protein